MATTTQRVRKHTVQVLNKRTGQAPRPSIIVRLYDDTDKIIGTAVFKAYADHQEADLPTCDHEGRNVTAFFDISFFEPFVGILRAEEDLFWKTQWVQLGPRKEVTDVSLDTKEEILGEYFSKD